MEHPSYNALICMRQITRTLTYNGVDMLRLEIDYPEVTIPGNIKAQSCINARYLSQVHRFCRRATGPLYRSAVSNYCYAQEMGYPFNAYDLVMKYETTLNERCHLSGYNDSYEYTGGAHGITQRASDTFDLRTGMTVRLSCLFSHGQDWRSALLGEILRQADENMRQNPGIYFDNYRELILKYFNPRSFYLTPTGIAVYYQQYDIGPYVTGIVVFDIPYEQAGATPPSCSC